MMPLRGMLSPLGAGRGGAVESWWLSGGIAAANCIAAYQPKGAASLAASYVNLVNPGTYDAFLGVAPTLDALGWLGTSLSYLKTGIIPSSGWSAFCRVSNVDGANVSWAFGSRAAPGAYFSVLPNYAGTIYYENGGTKSMAGANITSACLGFAGNIAYRNGVAETGTIGAWSGTGIEIYLLALNSGTPGYYFSGKILQAAVFYNTIVTPAQALAVSNAMNLL